MFFDWKRTLLLFPIALCLALLIITEEMFLRALLIIPLVLLGVLREIFLLSSFVERHKGSKN